MRRDAEAPALWRIATDPSVTTDTFEGVDGSTYAFWTRAWDRAGNIEPPPGSPDAITTIRLNRAPTANGQQVSTEQDTDLPVVLTGTDPDADTITFEVVAQPANGTLIGTAPNLTYRPAVGFTGADAFTFLVSDGDLVSTVATIAIDVIPAGRVRLHLTRAFRSPPVRQRWRPAHRGLSIRTDRHGVVSVRRQAPETIAPVRRRGPRRSRWRSSGSAWTKLYVGTIRVDHPGAAPQRFTWTGAVASSAEATSSDTVGAIAVGVSRETPKKLSVINWSITDRT